ncbi:MAG: hypothetical protein JW902_01235 [Syntrophaceae bacterium]|nr:hypothetical protein [Syntrophaceae bacterium]
MAKNYETEIREVYGKKYLKIFLKISDHLSNIQSVLSQLPSVAKVNITSSESKYSPPENLTIYPKVVFSIEEMKLEVEAELERFFGGGTSDPVFTDVNIPALSDQAYFEILDRIIDLGINLEKYPGVVKSLDEEGIRNYFLPHLNSISKSYSATGETFNKKGRTDILIQDNKGNNVFIAECKLWKGQSYLSEAIDQLLERYVSWRDEKTALLVFNKDVSSFSDVIKRGTETLRQHPNCLKMIKQRRETSFSYLFRQVDDPEKKIDLELVFFNFY